MRIGLGDAVSRRALLGAIAVVLLVIGWWSLHQRSPSSMAGPAAPSGRRGGSMAGGGPVPVVAAKVEQKDMPIYLDGLGTVQAFNTVTVHTRVDGQLQQVLFSEGQDVRSGYLLAVVDPRPPAVYSTESGHSRRWPDFEGSLSICVDRSKY